MNNVLRFSNTNTLTMTQDELMDYIVYQLMVPLRDEVELRTAQLRGYQDEGFNAYDHPFFRELLDTLKVMTVQLGALQTYVSHWVDILTVQMCGANIFVASNDA